jgi:hypothetical protein
MQPRLPAAALAAALLAGVVPPAAAQADRPRDGAVTSAQPGPLGEREVTLANRSALAITEIYVSPTSTDAWGEDRLGEAVLEPGRTLRLRLGRLRDCAFDVLVIYQDASREERAAQNLCRQRQVAFDGKARSQPQAALQVHQVLLANQSGRAIQQVFVSAADAPDWGADLLARSISVGENGSVTFRGGCTVDIRVVFENRAAEERRGIDLCRRASLSIEPGWTTTDELPSPPA